MAGKYSTPIKELPAKHRAALDDAFRSGLRRRAERLAAEAAAEAEADPGPASTD